MKNNSPTLEKIDNYRRNELKELLHQCNPDQHLIFKRMYSHANLELPIDQVVDNMPADKLDWATQQCERSIESNKSFIK